MNFGRAVGLFNRFSPKISKGIGQVANIARNIGQAVQNVRNIGSYWSSSSKCSKYWFNKLKTLWEGILFMLLNIYIKIMKK